MPQSVLQLRSDATQDLSDVMRRMMSKNPDDRFQSPQGVAIALAPLGQHYRRGLIGNVSSTERTELAAKSLTQFERSMSLQGEANVSSSTLIDIAQISLE